MKYEDIRDSLDTGDIVLFSGKGRISDGIKFFTISNWSHVGVVIRCKELESLLLWESTTLCDLQDAIDGRRKNGVQTVLLSERIRTYDGEIAIRRLRIPRTSDMISEIVKLRREIKNRKYEEKILELLKAAYDNIMGENVEDLSSVFCSELVAEMYQRMGLLSHSKPSNEYVPADFSTERSILLTKGFLEPEIILTT